MEGESMVSFSTGYAVTMIVEGGLESLEVLKNDIGEGRPILLIQVFACSPDESLSHVLRSSPCDVGQWSSGWSVGQFNRSNIDCRWFTTLVGTSVRLARCSFIEISFRIQETDGATAGKCLGSFLSERPSAIVRHPNPRLGRASQREESLSAPCVFLGTRQKDCRDDFQSDFHYFLKRKLITFKKKFIFILINKIFTTNLRLENSN